MNNNQLTELPEWLGRFTQLDSLEFSGNQVTVVPESISALTSLNSLGLGYIEDGSPAGSGGNPIEQLPEWLGNLTDLTELGLDGCKLGRLPDWLGRLINLKHLYVDHNQLTELPASLGNLKSLIRFEYRYGNSLPPELIAAHNEGLDAVKEYLRAKADDQIVLNEAKLILVGEGEVGKSCLLDALRNEPWKEHDSTHGIRLAPVEVTDEDTGTVMTLNGWDFGGQRVYRPTHQLFFSSPAVYLVVWKPREGQQAGQVKEWIKLVKHREPEAKILVVATHGGPKDRQPDIDRYEITTQFGHDTVVDFHWVDSKPAGYDEEDESTWTGERTGISELRDAIARVAAALPEVGREVPGKWHELWEALENHERSWMSWDDFRCFCTEDAGTTIAEDQFDLFARLSHTLGHLIHYDYDSALREIVILKPDWLATAVSFVLDDGETRRNHGLVTLGRLNQLWNDPERDDEERYPVELHPAFLRLMDRFDLSYEVELPDRDVEESDRTILVAQLVPDTRPESFPDWHDQPAEGDFEQVQICRIVDDKGQSAVAEGLF